MLERLSRFIANLLGSEAEPEPERQPAPRQATLALWEEIARRPQLTVSQREWILRKADRLGLSQLGRVWCAENRSFTGFKEYARRCENLPNRRRRERWCDPIGDFGYTDV
jgi:hypothetical protein